jgi:hypothetical protein
VALDTVRQRLNLLSIISLARKMASERMGLSCADTAHQGVVSLISQVNCNVWVQWRLAYRHNSLGKIILAGTFSVYRIQPLSAAHGLHHLAHTCPTRDSDPYRSIPCYTLAFPPMEAILRTTLRRLLITLTVATLFAGLTTATHA